MRLPHQFQGQRSRSPAPLMLTHIMCHIFRMARPTNFKLGIRIEDDDPHQPQVPQPPKSQVKVARSRDQSEPSCPNAVPLVIRGGRGHTVLAEPGSHTSCFDHYASVCPLKHALRKQRIVGEGSILRKITGHNPIGKQKPFSSEI